MTHANALDIDWAALETHVTPDGEFCPPIAKQTSKFAKTQHFPCERCGGTGMYRGVRRHQEKEQCFACGGKGYFLTSPHERSAKRKQVADRKARKLQEARAAFDEQNPGIAAFLGDAARWSSFAVELLDKLNQHGSLTEAQVAAVRSMQAKIAAKRAEREVERKTASCEVDLTSIRAMFERAVESGYQRPIYRAAGLEISRAPDHGRNPGALYIKDAETDEYLGKILGTVYSGKPAPGLEEIAADPRGAAIRYGQRTGKCSCCGRMLTAEGSIEAGIGPICAGKWGL
ncbi:MAG: DUF6011 domain-containing protein [Alphaproteobacteria bacterium]